MTVLARVSIQVLTEGIVEKPRGPVSLTTSNSTLDTVRVAIKVTIGFILVPAAPVVDPERRSINPVKLAVHVLSTKPSRLAVFSEGTNKLSFFKVAGCRQIGSLTIVKLVRLTCITSIRPVQVTVTELTVPTASVGIVRPICGFRSDIER